MYFFLHKLQGVDHGGNYATISVNITVKSRSISHFNIKLCIISNKSVIMSNDTKSTKILFIYVYLILKPK